MASVERVYEDFVPPHQMQREPATHTLTVNLSAQGYKKEHIRVQMVHSHRRLIVRGERPVDGDGTGNRWSRFRLELRVPDGCDAKAIHAKFDNGVVRVTMPGALPEPVTVLDSVTGGTTGKQQPQSPAPPTPKQDAASTAAAVAGAGDVQDRGDRDRAAPRGQEQDDDDKQKHETPRKQEARQRVVSSAKDAGGDGTGGAGEVMAAASPASARHAYGFLQNRKTTTTVLGVVLVLISLGIYFRYSFGP